MIITVNGWEKYNPRRDYKRPWWFGFNNNFFFDPDFYEFNDQERLLWIYILCETSRYNKNGELKFNFDHATKVLNQNKRQIQSGIDKLVANSIVSIDLYRIRTESVQNLYATEHNITEHNRRGVSGTASDDASHLSLLEVWNQECGSLPKAKAMSKGRAKKASSLFKENSCLNYWRGVVRILASSKFCNGENQRGWRADFDFFLKPETHIRATEGKYGGSVEGKLLHPETKRIMEDLKKKKQDAGKLHLPTGDERG